MSDDTPSLLNNVSTIDDERIKSHLERCEAPWRRRCSKTCKFDYLIGPNHPAHSIALEFFTDD
jgi:hypothetical protein